MCQLCQCVNYKAFSLVFQSALVRTITLQVYLFCCCFPTMDTQKTKSAPTIRFNLPLSQPTDDHYNEFSYAKLFGDVVKKVKTVNINVLLGRVGF